MPDFNQFAPKVPAIKQEGPQVGLSLLVSPKYDYVNTFPPEIKLDTDGNPQDQNKVLFSKEETSKLNQMFGGVPIAPAGVGEYKEARKFNRDDLGFIAGRDNENLYAENQGVLSSIGNGLARLGGLTVTKLGTGLGYLSGLAGIGNDYKNYGTGFSAWIAGAADNGFAKWFQNLEDEKIKKDWFPIYAKATEKDHGFFRHMGDLDFWTSDLTDGLAFIASSYVPGMAMSKLNLGAKTLRSLSLLKGIGYGEEAGALAKTGVEGTVESENLLKQGLGAPIESPEVGKTIVSNADGIPEIPRALGRLNNAKLARNIDVGTTSLINTASQAMFSAAESKESAYNTLINQHNEDGTPKYSTDQAKNIAAKVARDSYLMNLGTLALMNLYEANLIFKKPGLSNKFGAKDVTVNGIMGDATLAEKTFGHRLLSNFKEPAKGFVTGGVWLGNMQLAIDRLNSNPDNFDLDFGEKLKLLAKQYGKQTAGIVTGDDPDAAKALGIGGVLAAGLGKVLGPNEGKEKIESVANLNKTVSAFRALGNIYKTDEAGKLILEGGRPVIDNNKARSWVASMNNVLSLKQVANNFENRGVEEMAKLYNDEVFSRFAKAHFDAGQSELLYKKFDDLGNINQEDLALLGFDPESKDAQTPELLQKYKARAKMLEDVYNNIHNNFVSTSINLNKKEGRQKYFDITDKMFHLSSRANTLAEILRMSENQADRVKGDLEGYNKSYNSLTDDVVNQYNKLFEDLEGTKRRSEGVAYNQRRLEDLNRQVDRTERGVTVTGPSRIERIRRENPSVAVTLPQDYVENHNAQIAEKQAALDNFVTENKEVLERLKKDSRGRYQYEIANKNLLPSAKELERQQIIQTEISLAHNATINVLSRLGDAKFGERYYDEIYKKELDRHALEVQDKYADLTSDENVSEDQKIKDAYKDTEKKDYRHYKTEVPEDKVEEIYQEAVDTGKVKDSKDISEVLAEKIARGEKLTDKEQVIREAIADQVETKLKDRLEKSSLSETFDELYDTRRERDALEGKEDRTQEEEDKLQELTEKIDGLEEHRDTAFEQQDNKFKVEQSDNVKPEDKSKYIDILNRIGMLRKRVQKMDDHYEVDGQRYRKVTDLIGDTISSEQRDDPATQAAVNAGNAIDQLTKAYFADPYSVSTDESKAAYGSKMSEDTYNNVIKTLDKIKAQLKAKGVEIVSNNVIVLDHDLKVAGEIDLLGVDKDGNFKVYEIQARRGDVYRQYGKRGLGIKIRDIDGKRLSMYRNMFANQYGAAPDEISVKFPFEVKYDKTNPAGFIEDVRMREPIRFTPLKNVEIKMKLSQPVRLGAKFNSVDMTRIFLDTFLSNKLDQDKLKFLFRNVPFKEIISKAKLIIRPAAEEFQTKYRAQKEALNGAVTDFKVKKFRDYRNKDENGEPKEFPNLYSLVGNTEIGLNYEGQPIGYFSPVQTLAYKDAEGKFQVLDENTDPQTYADVTGNDISTFSEFKNVAKAYKKLHTELTHALEQSGGKEVTIDNADLKKMIDLQMSYGELDLVKRQNAKDRPTLNEIAFPGVKVGDRYVPTVVNLDQNDAVKVLMDKTKKTKKTIDKYREIDKWANDNLDKIKAAIHDENGRKTTNDVAIVETPQGDYKIISLRPKEGTALGDAEDFVDNLGNMFTTSTTKNVFKNENLMIVPKQSDETVTVGLKDHKVLSEVYKADDVESLEKFGLSPTVHQEATTEQKVDDFLNNVDEQTKQDLEDMHLNSREAIVHDFTNGDWSSIDDYLDNFKNCK